ncbi:MAG TPA: hypothetical protein VFS64_10120 [Solirubrobacterales bacterium]|nr:hypothetical protein [Solirubrobacterales bacterium]
MSLPPRRLRAQQPEGVERGLRRLDPRQGRIEQLDRADLAVRQQLGLSPESRKGELIIPGFVDH